MDATLGGADFAGERQEGSDTSLVVGIATVDQVSGRLVGPVKDTFALTDMIK